jgi:hypothetical protein
MKKGGGESLAASFRHRSKTATKTSAYFTLTYLAQFFPSLSVV